MGALHPSPVHRKARNVLDSRIRHGPPLKSVKRRQSLSRFADMRSENFLFFRLEQSPCSMGKPDRGSFYNSLALWAVSDIVLAWLHEDLGTPCSWAATRPRKEIVKVMRHCDQQEISVTYHNMNQVSLPGTHQDTRLPVLATSTMFERGFFSALIIISEVLWPGKWRGRLANTSRWLCVAFWASWPRAVCRSQTH
ncbi:hypothetical protein K449DRAFT_433026 [Hypoxylon sp. EC38]|nr:hypothetical protein K449DRAFT_433026 [Hypoxylon sp. EC38]